MPNGVCKQIIRLARDKMKSCDNYRTIDQKLNRKSKW